MLEFGREFLLEEIDPDLAHGVAVSRCRFFLPCSGDFFAEGGVVFQMLQSFE